VLFVLYAAAAAMLAPAMLRGTWAARSPQLAMTLWLVLPVSWVAAIVLAILAATAAVPLTWSGSPQSAQVLLAGQPVPGGRVIAIAGLLVAAAVVLRAAGCVACELCRGQRDRREHAALVAATGRPGDELDVAIVDHDAPAVYCLPCGRYQIVISAGALAALTPEQLRAVLAHERAHLRRRHHVTLALATALARAFRWPRWQPTTRLPAATAATTWPPRWSSWPAPAPSLPRSPPADPKPLPASSGSSLRSSPAPGLPGWPPSPASSRL
jgi:Zn-dependent protease with chaperone function